MFRINIDNVKELNQSIIRPINVANRNDIYTGFRLLGIYDYVYNIAINPFVPNAPFLYPLKP